MPLILHSPWVVVGLPFLLAAVIALLGPARKGLAPWIAALGPLMVISLSFSAGRAAFGTTATASPWTSALVSEGSLPWFTVGRGPLGVGWAIDSLTAVMLARRGRCRSVCRGLLGGLHG